MYRPEKVSSSSLNRRDGNTLQSVPMPGTLQRAAFLLALALYFAPAGSAQAPQTAASPQKAATRPDPKRSQRFLEKGKRAEAAARFEEALGAYDEAAWLDPRAVAALERGSLLRSRLVHERMDEAERLALAGDSAKAAKKLREALRLDPGNAPVAERLGQIEALPQFTAQTSLAPETRDAGPVRAHPGAGKRSFDLRGDTLSVYEQVGHSFGLTVLFDPELALRNVRLRLNDVDFKTAADILAVETGTFYSSRDETTLLVAADTQLKRKEYDQTIEQTFSLPAAATPEEMTELLRALREITGASHIQLDTHGRSLLIRDTPRTVALAGAVIRQVEQARGELMLDIELLEVDRNEALKLGITPPTSARAFALSSQDIRSLEQAKDLATLIGILQRIFGTQGALGGVSGQTGVGALVPPLVAFGGGKSTLLATLPGAAAQFSQALSLVRSGRRILLRAQDGKPASLFVGDRFPITLTLLSASLGTTSFTPVIGPNLFPRSDFNVGKGPVAVVAADLNGDGQRDLAVANLLDNSVSILLNQGQGKFTPAAGSPVVLGANQTGPVAIAAPDVNGDGIRDLLVVNQTSNNVTVLLGKGDGTFSAAPASPVAVGSTPRGIAVADFNGDGKLDFAVANFGDNTISVFLGDGQGGFTPAPGSPFLLPGGEQGPNALVAADFDNDGKPDLAVVDRTTNQVSVLLGKGDGTFSEAAKSPIAVGKSPVALAAGDLNGDTRPDLAVVNQTDATVTVLLNNGDATFSLSASSPLATGTSPSSVDIADFNLDGLGDIVVTNQGADTISVNLGLGAGLFAPRLALPTAAGPSAVVAADLNGDGRPDAAIAEETANQVSIIFDPVSFGGSGGVGALQQPYPGSEYVDLGLKVKATPVVHPHDEVTLQLEFEIRALSGQSVNGIPILSNRTISQTIRVRENETTLIGGLLDTEETRALSGLPGFTSLPGGAYLAGSRNKRLIETQLLILVTPRPLRLPSKNSRTIYAGRGGPAGTRTPPSPRVDQ